MEGGPEASMGIGSRLVWHGKTKQNPNQSTTCVHIHMCITHMSTTHTCVQHMHACTETLEKSIKLKNKSRIQFLIVKLQTVTVT